ncbi:MAG: sugar phosphate isomerase/epimerase [Phycisphaerae bacterium]|nr:sugar phosphate isomerase/epimerase [Phycisphaerae bacterium]
MKYAFMTFSCPELSLDEVLALAKRLGYEGVEPRVSSSHKHGLEFDAPADVRGQARAKAEASGVALCCIATSCRYADPATADGMVQDTHRAIDLAADVGCSRIRVFGGQIPAGTSREEAIELVARSLESVADHAGQRGVVVCMETHDDWCDPANVAQVMQRVDHPAIAVNWDIMHPVRQGGATMDQAYETLEPWIRHVHFHDGVKEDPGQLLRPIGEGIVDHKRAVELLLDMGYEDYLSGEWINWEPYETHLPRELATMKGYEREVS